MSAQKVALITAGTAGLGAAVARVLAPDFRVVINYANNVSRAELVLKELESIPSTAQSSQTPRFHAIRADGGDKAAVQNMVKETLQTMGRLDVVISNVGWTRLTNFQDLDDGSVDEDWDKCFTYNVKTHLWLMNAARAALEETEGAFITTASIAGVKPAGSSLPYAVTKAAQIHLAKCLANITGPKIRVTSVSPGLMLTEWGLKFPQNKIDAHANGAKLKRLATPEDVAQQVRCLALNRSITGHNFLVDSGFTQ